MLHFTCVTINILFVPCCTLLTLNLPHGDWLLWSFLTGTNSCFSSGLTPFSWLQTGKKSYLIHVTAQWQIFTNSLFDIFGFLIKLKWSYANIAPKGFQKLICIPPFCIPFCYAILVPLPQTSVLNTCCVLMSNPLELCFHYQEMPLQMKLVWFPETSTNNSRLFQIRADEHYDSKLRSDFSIKHLIL